MTFAILAFSIIAFAFSSIVMMPGMKGPIFGREAANAPIERYVYEPPERKSIIVDNDGASHQTADLTHSTKRDRSRRIEKWKKVPSLNVITGEQANAMTESAVTPVLPPATFEPAPPVSVGRLVKGKLVTDPQISQFTRSSIGIRSSGRQLTLWGHAIDPQEKNHILAVAQSVAGPGNVVDHLKVMGE